MVSSEREWLDVLFECQQFLSLQFLDSLGGPESNAKVAYGGDDFMYI